MRILIFSILGVVWGVLGCFLSPSIAQVPNTVVDSLRSALQAHPQKDSAHTMRLILLSNHMSRISMDSAKIYAQKASASAAQLKNPMLDFTLLMLEGSLESIAGQDDKALNLFIKALGIAHKQDGATWDTRKGMVLNNIGGIFYNRSEHDKSIEYLKRAVRIQKRHKISVQLGDTYRGIGLVYLAASNQDSAKSYLDKSIEVYTVLGLVLESNLSKKLLAGVLIQNGQPEASYALCIELLPFFQTLNVPLHLAEIQSSLGRAALELDKNAEAYSNLRAARPVFKLTGSIHLQRTNNYYLYKYFEKIDRPDSAYYYLKDYKAQDSILSGEEKNRMIAKVEARYQSEVAAQENELLKQENADIHFQNTIYLLLFFALCVALIITSVFLAILQKRKFLIERQNETLNTLNREVELALKQTIRLSQEKQHLIGILGNDLRSPLEAIQLHASQMEAEMDQTPPELEEIRENARLIYEFSLRILAAQNIETLDIHLYLQPVVLHDTVAYVMQRFKSMAGLEPLFLHILPCFTILLKSIFYKDY